ncbi:MAG: DUF4258 domain-containing protein [Promethearchaeota archaeon]
MPIIYTKHVLIRMKSRNISHFQIEETLEKLDQTSEDDFGNSIAQKMFGKYLIHVIYRVEDENIVIITAYRTSKLDKYSNLSEN